MKSIKNSNALSSPIAASTAAILGRFLQLGTGALTAILLPVCMSQETVGLFFLVQSLIAALATLGQLGLHITAPACISHAMGHKDFGRIYQIIRQSWVLNLLTTLIISIGFSLFIYLLLNAHPSKLINSLYELAPVLSLSIIFLATVTLLSEQHRAIGNFIQSNFLASGAGLASALAAIIAWKCTIQLSLETLLIASVAGLIVSTLLGEVTLWRRRKAYPLIPNQAISYKEILMQTYPNLTTTIVLFAVAQADLWIIAYFGTYSDLAVYGLATRLSFLILIPLAMVNTVIAPSIGRLFVRKKTRYLQRILGIGAGAATVLAVLSYSLFILTGKPILTMLWSVKNTNAYYIFAILGISQIAQSYAGSAGYVLIMLQKQHITMRISVGVGILTIVFGILTMAKFGVFGLALVYALGGVLQSFLIVYYVKNIFGLDSTADFKFLKQFALTYFNTRHSYGK